MDLERLLNAPAWRRVVYELILRIPSGRLVSYGRLASLAEEETGSNPGARNVAWLRRELYGILGHDTDVPLHRIATAGDVASINDSVETRNENNLRRGAEGSLGRPWNESEL